MPPARKTYPHQAVADTATKRPLPRHVVDLQDLLRQYDNKSNRHLVVKIDQFSPEEISIKRRGDELTVDTKSGNKRDGQGIEHVTRRYRVPAGGYTKEFGAQVAADGLISIRRPGMLKTCARVIPINIAALKQMKPGTVIKIKTADLQKEFPLKFASYVVKPNSQTENVEMEDDAAESNDQEMEDKDPGSNADEDMDVPDNETMSPDSQLDDSA